MTGVITLPYAARFNYGNILQNYALCRYIRNLGCPVEAIHCAAYSKSNELRLALHHKLGLLIEKKGQKLSIQKEHPNTICRNRAFHAFIDEEIQPRKFSRYSENTYQQICDRYDRLIVGSDQVWNPFWAVNEKTANTFFLEFFRGKRISYAASFGVTAIPEEKREIFRKGLNNFDHISVREEAGAKIVEDLLGAKPEVVIDPTMLLCADEWRAVQRKNPLWDGKPYILTYFLGEQDDHVRDEIVKAAASSHCDVQDISPRLDSSLYTAGPREFIGSIDRAAAVYTDSFHAAVFSILFGTPYAVYDRKQKDMDNMSSRIDTLLHLLELPRSCIKWDAGQARFNADDKKVCQRLKAEREKADSFLRTVLEIR